MTRTVFCKKYQQELEGLDKPPYPGAKGQDIFENVSKKAWEEWQAHQTMIINEKQLSMVDPSGPQISAGEKWRNSSPARISKRPKATCHPASKSLF